MHRTLINALAEDVGRAEVFSAHRRQLVGSFERGAYGLIGFPEHVRPVEGVGIERATVVENQSFCRSRSCYFIIRLLPTLTNPTPTSTQKSSRIRV